MVATLRAGEPVSNGTQSSKRFRTVYAVHAVAEC